MHAQNSNKKLIRNSTKAPFQWRFLWIFTIAIGPIVFWPFLLNGHSAALALFAAWAPFLSVHALIPILDWLFPEDDRAPIQGESHWVNKSLPVLCLPLWLVVLFVSIFQFSGAEFNAANLANPFLIRGLELLGVVLSLGAIGGILSINPSHELIHRNSKFERTVGGVLLSATCYAAFKIEHVRGHHLNVATAKDTASARRGQNIFAFIARSALTTVLHAHHLEAARLERKGLKPWSIRGLYENELVGLNLISVSLAVSGWLVAGWVGLFLFVGASLGAIFQLEVVNFIEHYGLERQVDEKTGRPETVQPVHSWNTSTAVGNVFLFNLQRHSDHHAHAGKDYVHLDNCTDAPQLPYGYGTMYLIACVPPLWRKIMHPRLDALIAQRTTEKA
jgi:alkane 1-monooxygenase